MEVKLNVRELKSTTTTLFWFLLIWCKILSASDHDRFQTPYADDELTQLWSSISDIHNPTLQEYRLIEDYLSQGERVYLSDLNRNRGRLNIVRNLKLIGPDGEMPSVEKYSINIEKDRIDERTRRRCILLYASFNGIYPTKARKILSELQQCGYSGHVLLRIGGFPNTQFGGLEMCHIPYAFKVAFLREAQLLGYEEVLWLDTAIHPLTNLEMVFQEIHEKGYFLTTVSTLEGNEPSHFPNAAESLGITTDLYPVIPHIHSAVIGLNMNNALAVRCLEKWLYETQRVYPNINGFPEELSLSVTAWRLHCLPYSWSGEIICGEYELPSVLQVRPKLQFFQDALR